MIPNAERAFELLRDLHEHPAEEIFGDLIHKDSAQGILDSQPGVGRVTWYVNRYDEGDYLRFEYDLEDLPSKQLMRVLFVEILDHEEIQASLLDSRAT